MKGQKCVFCGKSGSLLCWNCQKGLNIDAAYNNKMKKELEEEKQKRKEELDTFIEERTKEQEEQKALNKERMERHGGRR